MKNDLRKDMSEGGWGRESEGEGKKNADHNTSGSAAPADSQGTM